MSTVQEIEDAIEALPQEEFFKVAGWVSERFSTTWDRQIEDDVRAGRLDDFAAEALAEFDAGRTCPFPGNEK